MSVAAIKYRPVTEMGTPIFQIISTDRTISGRWQNAFQKEGWLTKVDPSYLADNRGYTKLPEIVLIEVGVPGCKCLEDLRSMLRARHPVSVILFGDPQKISNCQIAAFLEAGADDFIQKNLDERVLVAKLKAHTRRLMPVITEAAAKLASDCGNMEIDLSRRAVRIEVRPGKYSELLNLTQKELDILSLLVCQECRVITRESMLEKLWGDGAADVYSECVDKHIESLRKKLGLYGKWIKTVYGAGYMFKSDLKA